MNLNFFRFVVLGILTSIFIFSTNAFCQNAKREKKPFKDRIFIGGALGFSMGSYSTLVDVSPIFGYAVTDNFIAGIGLTYKYYQYRDYYLDLDNGELLDYRTNMYGGSLWARYFLSEIGIPVIENMFLHGEIEPLIFQNDYLLVPSNQGDYIDGYGNYYVKQSNQVSMTGIFFGGGLRQMLGARSYMYIELLWNFNEGLYSPYSNPRIRIGVAAGF